MPKFRCVCLTPAISDTIDAASPAEAFAWFIAKHDECPDAINGRKVLEVCDRCERPLFASDEYEVDGEGSPRCGRCG